MALNKKPAAQPQFESEDEGVATATVERSEPETQAPAAPAASTSTAVATRTSGAVAARNEAAQEFANEVKAMQGALDTSYGNFPSFKGIQGGIKGTGENKDAKLGRWIKGTMMSWAPHWEISPGGNDKSQATKDVVAYSADGETIDRCIGSELTAQWAGRPVQQYLEFLKSDWPQAEKREFIDLVLLVEEADKGGDSYIGEAVQLVLSRTSIPAFKAYEQGLMAKAMARAKGLPVKLPENPFSFYVHVEDAQKGDNSWTKLKVATSLPKDF